jgi:hypothetical protein
MLAAEHYSHFFSNVTMPQKELLEVHRSKLSIHSAKTGYSYPTI